MNIPGTILFVSAFYNRTGLAGSARAWVKTLHNGGNRVRVLSINDEQPGVNDFDISLFKKLEQTPLIPPISAVFFHNPTQDWLDLKLPEPHVRIMLTGFVGENVPSDWVDICNQMDQVCVMSNSERVNWIKSGVSTLKLSTLPGPNPWLHLPLNSLAHKNGENSDQKTFRFLSLGTFSPNRRWDTLIEAYLSAFSGEEDVELYLRVNYPGWHPIPGGPESELKNMISTLRGKTGSGAKIRVDDRIGTRMEIMDLLDSADLYVSTDVAYTATIIEAICRFVPVAVVESVYLDSPHIVKNAFRFPSSETGEMIEVTGDMLNYLPQYEGVSWPKLNIREVAQVLMDAHATSPSQLRVMGKTAYYQSYGIIDDNTFNARMAAVTKRAWRIRNKGVYHGDFPKDQRNLRLIGPGINALEAGEPGQAREIFSELNERHPESTIVKRLLAESYLQNDMWDETKILLEGENTGSKASSEQICLLGDAYKQSGHSDRARELYQLALVHDSPSPLAYLKCISLLIEEDEAQKALNLCLDALKILPNDLDLRAYMGVIFLHLGQEEAALKTWRGIPWERSTKRESLQLFFFTISDEKLALLTSADLLKYATSLYEDNLFEEAIAIVETLLNTTPEDVEVGDLYWRLMVYNQAIGEPDEAKLAILNGLKACPTHLNLLIAAVRERVNDWDYPEAVSMALKALEIHPEQIDIMLMLANSLLEQELYDDAYDILAKIHSGSPDTVGLVETLNKVAAMTGKPKIEITTPAKENHIMKTKSIYTKDALSEYIKKLGFQVGDYSYGTPIIRWWGEAAKLKIGRYCSFAANVKIYLGGNHRHDWVTTYPFPSDPMNENWPNVKNRGLPKLPTTDGDVVIGDDVWIGDDVSILSGITIGPGAVIAAKTMVTKDVPPFAIVGGNPGKIISYRFDEATIQNLLDIRWWGWTEEKVNAYMPLLCSNDLTAFLEAAKTGVPPEVLAPLSLKNEPKFTGERAMPLAPNMDEAIMVEHWARYHHAAKYVKGKRILDIACGAGYGSDYLADHAKTVVGGDIDPETVDYCKARYEKNNLEFKIMDIRDIPYPDNSFDAIVSFETIEHIEEWEKFLVEINRVVVEDGTLIISTPLGGPCGNDFHLCYFQRGDFKKRLQKYFKDVDVVYQRIDTFHKDSISPVYAETFTGEYALAVCKKPIKKARPLVSIVMLTFNALEYTQKCVDSLLAHTQYPHELIFVDNASTDGTVKYLQKLVKKHPRVKLIRNKENTGFAAGNNRGVEVAVGDYVMLLNNDVLVGDGWLETLVKGFEKDEHIGMIGPITNYISGRQMVKDVPYKDDGGFYDFATNVLHQYPNRVTPRRRIAGFAVLMEKTLYQQVDGFDESFGIGNFEDDDLCLKVTQAGRAIMVHEGVFLHHFGSQSFKANKIDYQQSLADKGEAFKQKWPDVDYDALLELKEPLSEIHPIAYQKAYAYVEAGHFEEAKQAFEKILAEDPLHEQAVEGYIFASRGLGATEQALEGIQRLLTLNPENVIAYNLSGLMAAESGDLEASQRLFEAALEKDGNFIDAQRNLAEVLLGQEMFQEGVQVLNNILENHPDDIPSLLRMAELNLEADRNEEASDLLQKVLEIVPEHPIAVEMLKTAEN